MTPRPDEPPQADALFGLDDLAPAAAYRHPVPAAAPPGRALLDIREIHAEPQAAASDRGREILARFPRARIVEIASHWRVPHLHGNEGNIGRWVRIKTEVLVVGVRKTFTIRPNGRSADWIAPGLSNGCTMACAYCYVPRRKGYANPITVFTNPGDVIAHLRRHIARQGRKPAPNQCDPLVWIYDVGENGDCSADALICDNTRDLIAAFRHWPTAKASFATKYVNPALLTYDPRGRTRVRLSVMPPQDSRLLDIRTSPVPDRLAAAGDLLEAGYEVHFNLSPVVLRPGWEAAWGELLRHMDDVLPQDVKAQAAAEVIMLTHNESLHEVNLGWHPRAEDVLWQPSAQEAKLSQNGDTNLRYRGPIKQAAVARLGELIDANAPWLRVRYAF